MLSAAPMVLLVSLAWIGVARASEPVSPPSRSSSPDSGWGEDPAYSEDFQDDTDAEARQPDRRKKRSLSGPRVGLLVAGIASATAGLVLFSSSIGVIENGQRKDIGQGAAMMLGGVGLLGLGTPLIIVGARGNRNSSTGSLDSFGFRLQGEF